MDNKKSSEHEKEAKSEEISFTGININFKKIIKILPILLIIFAMWFAFYVRSGPITLSGLDERIEQNTYARIQDLIAQQVDAQYPNLNPVYKQEMVQKEYQKVLETGIYEVGGQQVVIKDLAESSAISVKNSFKAENGQTYLNAIDPYVFYREAENMLETGTIGDILINGEGYNNKRLAPSITKVGRPTFHVWLEYLLFKIKGITADSSLGEKTSAIYLIPVIFAMLCVIPIFFILKKFTNNTISLFGSLLLVSISTFVSRTVAGFVDTDAYNVFFPLLIISLLIYAFLSAKKVLGIILASISGLFLGLYLWAWGSGWFIFLFAASALLSYIVYLFIIGLIEKEKIQKTFKSTTNYISVFLSFIISSFIFTSLIAKGSLLRYIFGGVSASVSGIAAISKINIWPNVYSSVAELNPASFSSIISSVGGGIIFLIAMLGLLFLSLDFKTENDKISLYKRILSLSSLIWFLLIIRGNFLVFLTANNPLIFLALLFVPIGLGILLGLLNKNKNSKIFITMLLAVWMAGTIFMSLNGVRFILLLAPAFAISFGFGLYYLANILNSFFTKEFNLKDHLQKTIPGFIIIGLLFIVLFIPMAKDANEISKGVLPNFDDAWYNTMYKIKNQSQEDAIITSWWDFGHFFTTVADRAVTFDGGSQLTPQAHWVGKLLLENDEETAHDILKMLVCGGNGAFDTILNITQDKTSGVKINKLLYSTFGKNREEKINLIRNYKYYGFTEKEIEQIIKKLDCTNPSENFLITSEDMVSKAGVWAHWGSWDFTKKYVHDNYNKKSASQIATELDENMSLIEKYVSELNEIDSKASSQDVKRSDLVNRWFADYPSYVPIQGQMQYPCQTQDNIVLCGNSAIIDLKNQTITGEITKQIKFKNLIIPQENELKIVEQDPNGNADLVLIPTGNGYNSMLTQTPLGASLFTRLFYMNGFGTKYFEKFDDVQSVTGVRVITWKVKWEEDINEVIEKELILVNEIEEEKDLLE